MENKQNAIIEFSISDLSQEFGITTRTIRHYEEIGLLTPHRRGQARIYSSADRTKLKLILRGKRLGFSLEESREIIEMYDPSQGNAGQLKKLISSIHHQRKKLKQQKDDINKMMLDLNDAEAACHAALESTQTKAAQT
jgi:DNA-binding transcriptional MerR regulator